MKIKILRLIYSTFFFSFFALTAFSQYQDYLGTGHAQGIQVSASSFQGNALPENTINGKGMDADRMTAGRLLNMATFGSQISEIDKVLEMGFEGWIDDQFSKSTRFYSPVMSGIWETIYQWNIDAGVAEEDIFGPYALHFYYTWWQTIITTDDQLRHRIAYALSQILVVSTNSDLRDYGFALSTYYDAMLRAATNNYYDILLEVSLHPSMGYYLSHLNNPKANPASNVHPDENYAREIMQLFSIGLYMLNIDGSRMLDSNGDPIPTYNNEDIKELAKIFTGLGPGGIEDYIDWTNEPYFGLGYFGIDKTIPMIMYEDWHEPGQKTLVGGHTIPAGQDGMKDIEDAVRHLVNHQNVGPFLARRMIQRMVKSNPSPGYIERVARVFNDNGEGTRGDMKAFVKAILLDPEALTCEAILDPTHGKLREPVLRYTQACRSFPIENEYDRYWNSSYGFLDAVGQMVLSSPTVFNFYTPDFTPAGPISDGGLVAPEFKIHNSRTSINYINQVNSWSVWNSLMWSWEGDYTDDPGARMNTDQLEYLMQEDPEEVINQLDILLTNGELSDGTRQAIRDAIDGLQGGDVEYERVRMAIYLIMISPDYCIFR